jgi:hypothetical protein
VSVRARLLAASAVGAVVLGALVSVAAWYVARYGPSGDGWSFRGNGAISVYFAIPAVLTTGWTAIAAHAAGRPRVVALGAGSGLVCLFLALCDVAILPAFGMHADQVWTPIVSLAVLVWMIGAPLFAAIPPSGTPKVDGVHVGAAVLWLLGTFAGLVIAGVILPPGS